MHVEQFVPRMQLMWIRVQSSKFKVQGEEPTKKQKLQSPERAKYNSTWQRPVKKNKTQIAPRVNP